MAHLPNPSLPPSHPSSKGCQPAAPGAVGTIPAKGGRMRRSAASVGVVLALAVASAGPAAEAVAQGPTVDTFAVSFVIASPDAVTPGTTAVCANLPAGTTLTGSGTEKSITTRRTDGRGIETIASVSHADG